jgi:hypothetical protein
VLVPALRSHASIFSASIRSTGITRLHRYYGRSDSCPAALRVAQTMNTGCPGQVSLFSSRIFQTFRLQTPLTFPIAMFGFPALGLHRVGRQDSLPSPLLSRGLSVTWASPPYLKLAKVTGRIEFTCVADGSFASGCAPPRLLATQLPSATKGQTSFRRGLGRRTPITPLVRKHHRRTIRMPSAYETFTSQIKSCFW